MTEPTNNQPNNQPTVSAEETAKFDSWFQDYVRRHEVQPGTPSQSSIRQDEGSQSQSGQAGNIEALFEAFLNRREQRQNSENRMATLEAGNADLKTKLEALTKQIGEKPKRTWKDAFSIFS